MEVVLLNNVKNLGLEGEVKDVASGYARNYLFPQGVAVRANKQNRERYQRDQDDLQDRRGALEAEAHDKAEQLSELSFTVEKATNEEGQLYGSVTPDELLGLVQDEGFEDITVKQILLDDAIDEVGDHTFRVHLFEDIEAELDIEVVSE